MKNKFIILIFLCFVFSIRCFAQSDQQRPNILFIAVDDLKPTIGSFGDTFAQTPDSHKSN